MSRARVVAGGWLGGLAVLVSSLGYLLSEVRALHAELATTQTTTTEQITSLGITSAALLGTVYAAPGCPPATPGETDQEPAEVER